MAKSKKQYIEEHYGSMLAFSMYDENTVKLLQEEGDIQLPAKKVNIPKDKLWNTKQLNSKLLHGIMNGDSIGKIASSFMNIVGSNKSVALRTARTSFTGAENKGRLDSYNNLAAQGIIQKKEWVAAHDERTRDSHADLDGEQVDIDKPFSNGLMHPGDSKGAASEVYNCRCTMVDHIVGIKSAKELSSKVANQYQGMSVTAQYYSMLDENKAIGNAFWKALNAEGKPSVVWKQYLAGEASPETAAKLDSILAKYHGTGQPIKPGTVAKAAKTVEMPKVNLDIYKDKSMTATYYSVSAEDKQLGKQFWQVIQSEEKPSAAWEAYVSGKAPKELTDKLDNILLQHEGIGPWSKPVSAKKAAKIVDDSEDLVKAKVKMEAAQKELAKIDNQTYIGIWKDPVSLADYKAKAGSIAAKKQWYYDQIEDLTHKIDAGDIAEALANNKIAQYEKYIDDLVEFETKGKLYAQYSDEFAKAAKEYKALLPVQERFGPGAYTVERKNAAVWAKSAKEADKALRETSGKVWRNATANEKDAIYEYTSSYHKFNEPLRGIEYGSNAYKGVGKTDLNAGHANNGKKLNAMTDIIDKCELPQDQWFQRGCHYSGMDKFFDCNMDLLRSGTQKELEKALLNKTVTEHGFMSMGSSKGKGFGGDILLNIYAPEGTKAMYVEPFSAFSGQGGKNWDGISKQSFFGSELETILQQNSDFIITKIERKGTGTIYFDLELVAQNKPQRWMA